MAANPEVTQLVRKCAGPEVQILSILLEPLEVGGIWLCGLGLISSCVWSLSSSPLLSLLAPGHLTLSQAISQIAQEPWAL